MLIVIGIIFGLGLLALCIFLGLAHHHINEIVKNFKTCNVIVVGKKGTGKDLLFQKVINKRKKEDYYANIPYGNKYNHVKVSSLSVAPNTYSDFINDKITKIKKVHDDGMDVYLSDGGIILPSQFDSILHKIYPSFPIYYALSRHLYAQNIHVNVQNLNRLWKALREQADYYIRTLKTIKLGYYIYIVVCITYDKYESCLNNLLPMGNRFFNKFSKAEQDKYTAMNGEIKKRFFIITKKGLKYDSRHFAKVIFNNIDDNNQIIPSPHA